MLVGRLCPTQHKQQETPFRPRITVLHDAKKRVSNEDDVLLLQYRYSDSRLRVDTSAQGSVLVRPECKET